MTAQPPEREPTTRGNPHERKLAALQDHLDTEIRALRSGADWARWLQAATRLPGQDFAAVLLIAAQRHGATMVAGYDTWQAAGRQVGKGERGIQILAPGPRLSYVWDISQTTGPPLPAGPAARLPAGQLPPGAWDALVALAASHGFSAGCGDCGGGAGATGWADRRIRVYPGLGAADAVRALAHEVAHVLLHSPAAYPPPASTARCRGVRKVEADSVAFVVCASLGLDVSGIVFPQVASWAGDDERARPAATVNEVADRILTAARTVTRHLTAAPPAPEPGAEPFAQPTAAALTKRRPDRPPRTIATRTGVRGTAVPGPPDAPHAELAVIHVAAERFYCAGLRGSWVPG